MTVVAVVYATPAELAAWLPSGVSVSDVDRVLARASELVDSRVGDQRKPGFGINEIWVLGVGCSSGFRG